jgi:hypothetical protein
VRAVTVPEQNRISPNLDGPLLESSQSVFDIKSVPVNQEQPVPLAFPEQFPRGVRTRIAIAGNVNDSNAQSMMEQVGLFGSIAQVDDRIDRSCQGAGVECHGQVAVGIG